VPQTVTFLFFVTLVSYMVATPVLNYVQLLFYVHYLRNHVCSESVLSSLEVTSKSVLLMDFKIYSHRINCL
jgi:hypothetical protein